MHRISILFKVYFVLALVVFLGSACNNKSAADKKPRETPPPVVDVMVARIGPVTNIIEANGTVIANESVELRPEVSGRLTYLDVPEGKQIAQGTVLARINSADLEAQVQKSKVQLDLAVTTEQRLKKLLDVGGVNQSDYDAAANLVNTLKADIAYTQTLIDKTIIRAPFGGIVGLRQVSPGAYVGPTNVIATIQKPGKLKIDFTLPEQYNDLIHIGSKVEVVVDAANEHRQKATIIALEPQANTQTRNLIVRAQLDEGTANPGAFVKVYVGADVEKKAILVPTNTIIPDDKNNQLILVKNGKASFVNIKTGVRSANNVEITKGVNEGDTIVVTGVLFARPNNPVKIRSVKQLNQLDDAP
jgi:membrane fusion protein (multidrug efflux system)